MLGYYVYNIKLRVKKWGYVLFSGLLFFHLMYHQSLSMSVTSTLFLVVSHYSHSLLTGKNLVFEVFSNRYKVVMNVSLSFLVGFLRTVVRIVHCTNLKVPFSTL